VCVVGANREDIVQAKPFAFRMATSILLGLDLSDEQATAFTDLFGVWLRGFMGLPFDLPFTTFGRAMQARRQLLAMVEEVILRRRVRDSQRDPAEAAASRDILSILLHDMRSGTEETLSLDELKDQVLLQMFAGHDTTSAALTSLAFVIARYPDVRRRLQEEVAVAFPDPAQPIPAEALRCARLPRHTAQQPLGRHSRVRVRSCVCVCSGEYLNAVIKEVLRVYTPVGGGFRDLSEDVEYQNQWFFPKGWKIR
jgi:cytochrome P450